MKIFFFFFFFRSKLFLLSSLPLCVGGLNHLAGLFLSLSARDNCSQQSSCGGLQDIPSSYFENLKLPIIERGFVTSPRMNKFWAIKILAFS